MTSDESKNADRKQVLSPVAEYRRTYRKTHVYRGRGIHPLPPCLHGLVFIELQRVILPTGTSLD
jgi:hypothetical protein